MLAHKTIIAGKALILLVTFICAGWALSVWTMNVEGLAQIKRQPVVDHSHHQQMLHQKSYVREEHDYQVPDIMLTNQDGRKLALHAILEGQEPVMLNFIFTTCTTICPVLSASFTQAQKILGSDASSVRMISISIDPEHDTPAKLKKYAQRFKAHPGWMFLTGDQADIVGLLKTFDAYRRDKMNHIPLTLIRVAPHASWIRIEGFASASDLVSEFQALTTQGDF